MYYGVEDFLEKTAKTRLAKEFFKTMEDANKIYKVHSTNPSTVTRSAFENVSSKLRRLDPYDYDYITDVAPALRTLNKKDAKLMSGGALSGQMTGMSRRFKPATQDEIMSSLQSDELRNKVLFNKGLKARYAYKPDEYALLSKYL